MTHHPTAEVAATALLRSQGIDGFTSSELRHRVNAGECDPLDPELLAAVDHVVVTRVELLREATALIEKLERFRDCLRLGRDLAEEGSIGPAALRFEALRVALATWTRSAETLAEVWKRVG